MFVIAGLGNPGSRYEKTRHNVGFQVIDRLAEKYGIEINQKKHRALCGTGSVEGHRVLLIKPQTYMNLSGESVREVMDFYKVDPEEEFLVIYDDISLDAGQLRIRKKEAPEGITGSGISYSIWGRRCFCGSRWGSAGSRMDTILRIMYWDILKKKRKRRCRKHMTVRCRQCQGF